MEHKQHVIVVSRLDRARRRRARRRRAPRLGSQSAWGSRGRSPY